MLVTVVVSHKPNILHTTPTTTTYKPTSCLNDNDYNYYYYCYYYCSYYTQNQSKIHRRRDTILRGIGAGAIYNANADFIGIVQKLLVDDKSVILLKSMPTINCPLNLLNFPHRKTFRRKALCQLKVDDAVEDGRDRPAAQPNHSFHRNHPMLLMAHSNDCNAAGRTHAISAIFGTAAIIDVIIMKLATLIQTTSIRITINFILYSYTLNRSLVDQPKPKIIES